MHVYVCMYACMCVFVCKFVGMHAFTTVRLCVYEGDYMHACMYITHKTTCTYTDRHTHTHTHTHTRTYAHTHTRTRTRSHTDANNQDFKPDQIVKRTHTVKLLMCLYNHCTHTHTHVPYTHIHIQSSFSCGQKSFILNTYLTAGLEAKGFRVLEQLILPLVEGVLFSQGICVCVCVCVCMYVCMHVCMYVCMNV
jgi:hypothetical protein